MNWKDIKGLIREEVVKHEATWLYEDGEMNEFDDSGGKSVFDSGSDAFKFATMGIGEETNVTADNTTFIMLMGVNKNPTKLGLKIQFTPKGNALDNETKARLRTLLQSKLNEGLREHKLQVSIDTDVPNPNVIGFMIDLASIKDMVVRSIGGSESAPEPEVDDGF